MLLPRKNSSAPPSPARGIWSLFGGGQLLHAEPLLPIVQVENIGREHCGKTALRLAFCKGPLLDSHPSGLELGLEDPQRMTRVLQDALNAYRDLAERTLTTTLRTDTLRFHLFDAEQVRLILQTRETIGQVLTGTTDQSPPEQQARYRDYVANLTQASVLWVVLSYPSQATLLDLNRFEADVQIYTAYLREALRLRQTDAPCAVAVVVSKIDGAFHSEQEAQATLTDERLRDLLGRLINIIQNSRRVGLGAIFPVSAFGFNTTVSAATANPVPADAELDAAQISQGEPDFLLKKGVAPRPFNLSALVWWSLWAGLMHHEVEGSTDREPELADVVRRLAADLEAMRAWYVPLQCRA